MKRFISILVKPFRENLAFFICLWVLVSFADLLYWTLFHDIKLALIKLTYGYIACYFLTLLVGWFPRRVQSWIKTILLILGGINLFIDCAVHYLMHADFSDDMVAIVYGTNYSESREFISMYTKFPLILSILAGLALAFLLYRLIKWLSSKYPSVFHKPFLTTCMFVYLALGGGDHLYTRLELPTCIIPQ